MSEDDGGGMTGRHLRGPGSALASRVHPLENNDLLAQILLRLPALPSSLVRASVVCKRWHGVVSDPYFLHTFRAHHRNPPVLGFFLDYPGGRIEFTSVLDPPDQIPDSRFSLPLPINSDCTFLRSHHGYVLISNEKGKHFLVWDPVTRVQRQVSFPRIPKPFYVMDGGVVCASTNQGHVHGACHSDPFRVVVVFGGIERFFGCVYSSETGAWGKLISLITEPRIMMRSPLCHSTLFMNSMCFLLMSTEKVAILEFDWSRQKLALVGLPSDAPAQPFFFSADNDCQYLVAPTDSGGLSFIFVNVFNVHVWKRIPNGVCDATWILANTIELSNLLSLGPALSQLRLWIGGLDEDGNVMFKLQGSGIQGSGIVFMVNLESKVFKKLCQKFPYICGQTFSSFYTPGKYDTICTMQLQAYSENQDIYNDDWLPFS